MYEEKFPNVDDLVVVQVKHVADMGAYVSLLEYDNIEGMILMSELSRRRIRSIPKLIRVGKIEVATVIRVDKDKGYIDLSKRRVSPEDIEKAENKFNMSKTVHGIFRHVAETCKVPLIELYQTFGWDLYKRFGHAYEALKLLVTHPDKVLGPYTVRDDVKQGLIKIAVRRLTPQPVKIRADLEATCFGSEGIDGIKEALRAGEAFSTKEVPIKITLVAPPLYVMVSTTMAKEQGIKQQEDAVAAVTKVIKAKGGDVNVKAAPRAVSERDDRLLQTMMEALDKQNQEVAGDDPTDD